MLKTISVYFSGTGLSIDDPSFQATRLFRNTQESDSQIKMGFNGCGVDFGFTGLVFGSGLDKQCDQVIQRIHAEIKAGHQINLNVYGHSRGGIAALLLAKQLAQMDKEQLAINLALLDPVPGNLISTTSLDPLQITLTNKSLDLSDCKPLRKVLALYPHVPLPAIACHAPLLARYPQETEVDIELVNGCHAEAEHIFCSSARLVQLRVEEFLIKNGTQLETTRNYKDAEAMKQTYLQQYRHELSQITEANSRDTHSLDQLVMTARTGAKFFNARHKQLLNDNSQEAVALSLQERSGFFSQLSKTFNKNPKLAQAANWVLISTALSGLLFSTGGLAAIPFMAPLLTQLGALSILAVAPIVGTIAAALWYVTKPFLAKWAEQLFYPFYRNHGPITSQPPPANSTCQVLQGLAANSSKAPKPGTECAPYQANSPLHNKTKEEPAEALVNQSNQLSFN